MTDAREDPFGSPLERDRALDRVAERWYRARRALAAGEVDVDPFGAGREVCTRRAFHEVLRLPDGDPLRGPLLRWTWRLLQQRVDWELLRAVAGARREPVAFPEPPSPGAWSLADCWRRALDPGPTRTLWVGRALRAAERTARLRRQLALRSVEIEARLASPVSSAELFSPAPNVASVAARFLDESAEVARAATGSDPARWLGVALAERAPEGWPARLDVRTISELSLGADFFASLPLSPPPLPNRRAPASFLLALRRLGVAARREAPSRELPACLRRDPEGLEEQAMGALLAALPALARWQEKRLGLGRGAARDARRAVALALLAAARVHALGVVIWEASVTGERAGQAACAEALERWFGVELPPAVAGELPRLDPRARVRFLGAALAAEQLLRWRDQHDEDWYDNPRARAEMRERLCIAPRVSVSEAEASDAASALRTSLVALC